MIRFVSLAAVAAVFAMPAFACEGFEVHDAYVRTSTPSSQSGAAFMIIHNHGTEDCHVTGARSEVAARTELHTHVFDAQGVARMTEIEGGFPLPADGERVLERGGDHVMLMGLAEPLVQGQVVAITFVFADGSEEVIEVPVDSERMPEQSGGHSGHSHSHNH
ncbi:MAG: copper chaperone PCu(A)C [Pararhodobacter sp.]